MANSAQLYPATAYAKELRQMLPEDVFQRNPARLAWVAVHLAVVGTAVATLLRADLAVGYRILLSICIGHSYGCLMYLAHEILHGTVVKSSRLQNWISGVCMLPYCIGPAHWTAWHNSAHHGHTTLNGVDPDSFGNVTMFLKLPIARFIVKFAPGSGHLRSAFFLGFWFSFQALVTLFVHSKHYEYWTPARRRRQIALFAAEVLFWGSVCVAVGSRQFLFIYALPMVFANMLQMSYIATNHLICEETEINDPLMNSLSVSTPRWVAWLHLNFGYHTEHHIFPYVNPVNAPRVRAAILEKYATRYHELPILKALRILYRTPPVHLAENELVDLRTGVVYSTLGPDGELPRPIDQVPVPVRPRRRQKAVPPTQTKSRPESASKVA